MGKKFKINAIIFFILIISLAGIIIAAKDFATTAPTQTPVQTDSLNTATSASQKDYSGKVEDTEKDIGDLIGLGKDQIKVKNADIQKPAGKSTSITLTPGKGSIKIKDKDGNWKDYSNLEKLKIKIQENGKWVEKESDAKIVINSKGEIEEAYFTSVNGGKYDLGNERIDVPKGGGVIYRKEKGVGKAQVSVPANTKINPPVAYSKGDRTEVSYRTWDNGVLELSNGYKIKGAIVSFTGDQISFVGESSDSQVEIDSMKMKKSSDSSAWSKTYLDFKGEVSKNYDSAYVSFNEANGKVVIGSNANSVNSPDVMFSEGNPYGIKMEKYMSADKSGKQVQVTPNFEVEVKGNSKGAYFSIQDRTKQGKTPLVETLNDFAINQDNGGFYYDSGKGQIYLRSTGPVVKGFGDNYAGTGSVPMEIHSYKTGDNGEKVEIKSNRVLVTSSSNEYGYGPNPNFIRINYYKQSPKLFTGVSNYLFYNYALTKDGFERFSGLKLVADDNAGSKWLSNPDNIRYLYDIMESVPSEQMKMIKTIHFKNSFWTCHAYADSSDMSMHMSVYDNLDADVMRHEMAHIVDFNDGAGNFRKEWDGKGLDRGPQTYSYGYEDMEDISTFLEIFSYGDDSKIKQYIDNSNPKHNYWRARVAVAYDNYYFTKSRMEEIYKAAGLPYDANALNKYRSLQEV
ncbi:Uncharacterised protein [uncultured archaeon]|nr:Uncharacterised protein [uncultured archaeon]